MATRRGDGSELSRRKGGSTVLVVGAAGFLGLEITRVFTSHGSRVRGLIRDPAKAKSVRSVGGEPVIGDVLEPRSLATHARGCDLIVHVAANPAEKPGRPDLARQVRVQGTVNLVEAARTCWVPRMVVGSGYWVYADQPDIITEQSRVDPQGESRINYDAELAGLAANAPPQLEVLVVRPGMVYGDGAWFRPVVEAIRHGTYRVIDGGRNHWSFVSLPDTATGFYTVAERGSAGEIYNIVDGTPRPWGEFARFVARRLDRPAPASETFDAAVKTFGRTVAAHLRANRAASSAKLMALGWTPVQREFQEGVTQVLAGMGR